MARLLAHRGGVPRRQRASAPNGRLPRWFAELDADGEVGANCLSHVLRAVREDGWTHHIQRLMVLGNWGLQRG